MRVKTVDIYEKGIRSYTFTSFNEVSTTTGNYDILRRADADPTTITSYETANETTAPVRPHNYTKTPTLYSTLLPTRITVRESLVVLKRLRKFLNNHY